MHRPPLVVQLVHPSTISQSFAGYPEIQNWTFIKTTFELTNLYVQQSEPHTISNARGWIVRVTLLQKVPSAVGKRHNPNEVLVKVELVQ